MNRIPCITFVSLVAFTAQVVLAVDKIPDKLPNGERPWPAVPEAEVQKIKAALPDKPEVPPQKPRKTRRVRSRRSSTASRFRSRTKSTPSRNRTAGRSCACS